MRVPFRQGIVQYKNPTFIQVEYPYAHLLADVSSPLILNIAAGQSDYLHAEKANVPQAWGPFAVGTNVWLYIDIDKRTAQRTFGTTTLEPIFGATAPTTPVGDQHWFDTTVGQMKVWSGTNWITVIRVFACLLQNGQIPISMSINSPNFAGTQVGDLNSVLAGYIIYDTNNNPIKTSNDTFITSEDSLRVNSLSASDVKVGSLVVDAIAQEPIPAFSIVEFADFGQIKIASTFVTSTRKQYGIIQKNVVSGESVNVVIDGPIVNTSWDWSSLGVNAYLYNDTNGQLVSTPAVAEQPPVAIVIDTHTIMLLVKVIITNLPPSLATTTISGTVKLSTVPSNPAVPVAVGDNDPRLTNPRIPLDHEHPISDIVDLQTELDTLQTTKFNKSGGTLTGSLILHSDPAAALEAATKQYVDNAIERLFWQQPINDPDLKDDSLNTPPTPTTRQLHIVGNAPTGIWTGLARHAMLWNGTTWVDLLGRSVQVGDRFGICMEFASAPGGSLVGRENNIAEIIGINAGNITYNFTSPTKGIAVLVDGSQSLHFGDQYTFNGTDWVEFSGTTFLDDHADVSITSPILGQALTFDGTKWTNATPVSALSGLSDVQLTPLTTSEVLTYNGSKWVNASLPPPPSTDINDIVPVQTGNTGKYLKTSGSVVSWDNPVNVQSYSEYYVSGSGVELGLNNTLVALTLTKNTLIPNYQNMIVQQVGGCESSIIFITSDGKAVGWGGNSIGQLGTGDTTNVSIPVQLNASTDWKSVSNGSSTTSTVFIKNDNTAWACGYNSTGQLGIGSTVSTFVPTKIGGQVLPGTPSGTLTTVANNLLGSAGMNNVFSGNLDYSFLVIALPWTVSFYDVNYTDVYINSNSALTFGTGSSIIPNVYSDINVPAIFVSAADNSLQQVFEQTSGVAPSRTYRIRYEGTNSASGVIGSPNMVWEVTFFENNPAKLELQIGTNASLSTLTGFTSNGILVDQWVGLANVGMEYTTTTTGSTTIPTHTWKQFACGYSHTLGIQQDNTLWASGSNGSGQFGDGTQTSSHIFKQIGTLTDWSQASCGYGHSSAVKSDGTLWTWGANGNGQLGINNTSSRSSPVQVGSLTNWKQVSCGYRHTAAVKTDGTLWAWGYNFFGQLGQSHTTNRSSPVQIGTDTTWDSVKCGSGWTVARKTDGTIWACGYNGDGQFGNNTTVSSSSVVQIGTHAWNDVYGVTYNAFVGQITNFSTSFDAPVTTSSGGTGLSTIGTKGQVLTVNTDETTLTWSTIAIPPALPGGSNNNKVLTIQNDRVVWAPVGSVPTQAQTAWACGYNFDGQLGFSGNTSVLTKIGSDSEWSQVSMSGSHTVAIKTDGTMWGMGQNGFGQLGLNNTLSPYSSPVQITSENSWSQAANTIYYGSAAIKIDGTLWTWGSGAMGQTGHGDTFDRSFPTQLGSLTNWSMIRGGGYFFAAIKSDGTLWTWGDNYYGQLGDNTNVAKSSPVQIGIDKTWARVECGNNYLVALDTSGNIWSCGDNGSGQIGDGSTIAKSSLVQVGAGTKWTTVSAAGVTTLGIDNYGRIWGWGDNYNGQIGNGSGVNASTPTLGAMSTTDWKYVKSAGQHSVGIKRDGTLWAWGSNYGGQFGNGIAYVDQNLSPIQIGTATNWTGFMDGQVGQSSIVLQQPPAVTLTAGWGIDISSTNVISLKPNYFNTATAYAVGLGTSGQLGDSTILSKSSLVQIGALTNWSQIVPGGRHNIAIKTDGTMWGWGLNSSGQVGDSTSTTKSSPVQIGTLTTWAQAACGTYFSCAIRKDGTLWTWGANGNGQLGINNTSSRSSPVQVGSLTNWKQVSAGDLHMAAIKTDGTLWACGYNFGGMLGDGTSTNRSSPVQIGTLTNWAQVICGRDTTLAFKTDGTLWGWGNSNGQFGGNVSGIVSSPMLIGTGAWKTASSGNLFAHYIKHDGTLWACGYNGNGQLGDGTRTTRSSFVQVGTMTNWSKVSSGSGCVFALKTDGTIWAWGSNSSGQLGQLNTTGRSSPVQIGSLTNWKAATVHCRGSHMIASLL